MKFRLLLSGLLLIVVSGQGFADTDTPTPTATNTSTPTPDYCPIDTWMEYPTCTCPPDTNFVGGGESTMCASYTGTPTATDTPEHTYTATDTPTATDTATQTPTATQSPTATNTTTPVQPTSRTTTYTYYTTGAAQGLIETIDGPRTDVNDITTYTYNEDGTVATITNAAGLVTAFTSYNDNGLPLTIVDANEIEITLTYNARGWLLTRTVPQVNSSWQSTDATTTFEYDDVGQVTQVTMPDGRTLSYEYTDAGFLEKITDDEDNYIEYTHDELGNVTEENTHANGVGVVRTHARLFDELGRLIGDINAAANATQYHYDHNDNVVTVTDDLSNATSNAYDSLQRLTLVTDAQEGETHYEYDHDNRITKVIDPRGVETEYTYDAFGNKTQEVSADRGTTQFNSYDEAGNVLRKILPNGVVIDYGYDELNRLWWVDYPGHPDEAVIYDYDSQGGHNSGQSPGGMGRLFRVVDDNSNVGLRYDTHGNILMQRAGMGYAYDTYYRYDVGDKLTRMEYPDGGVINYTYNDVGQLESVTTEWGTMTPVPIATDMTYLPFGPMKQVTYGNGVTMTRTFDQDYHLTNQTITNPSSTPIIDYDYGYDAVSNIDEISDALNSNLTQSFTYDDLYRLDTASQSSGFGSHDYDYDEVGNRTSQTINSASTSFSIDTESNRLETQTNSSTTWTYTYDDLGNITSKLDSSGNGQVYTYSIKNRLSKVEQKTGSTLTTQAEFVYNAVGQRMKKIVGSDITKYFYGRDGELIREDGITSTNYIWANGELLAISQYDGNNHFFIVHNNHLGAPIALTDEDGQVVWSARYTPFGEAIVNDDVDDDDNHVTMNVRFPGQYFDVETGLHYNYFRDYDPSTGRYLESDPIGLDGGLNTYAYVDGNPINLTDLSGLAPGDKFDTARDATVDSVQWSLREWWDGNMWSVTPPYKIRDTDGSCSKYTYDATLLATGVYPPLPVGGNGKGSLCERLKKNGRTALFYILCFLNDKRPPEPPPKPRTPPVEIPGPPRPTPPGMPPYKPPGGG